MDKQRAAIKVFGYVLFFLLMGYFVLKVVESADKLSNKVCRQLMNEYEREN